MLSGDVLTFFDGGSLVRGVEQVAFQLIFVHEFGVEGVFGRLVRARARVVGLEAALLLFDVVSLGGLVKRSLEDFLARGNETALLDAVEGAHFARLVCFTALGDRNAFGGIGRFLDGVLVEGAIGLVKTWADLCWCGRVVADKLLGIALVSSFHR